MLPLHRAPFGCGGGLGGVVRLVEHGLQRRGVDVAHVHRDARLTCHGSDDARPARDMTDRGDAVVAFTDFGDGERESCCGPEAVASHLHRHGARMGGLALEDQALALDALRAGDGADAQPLGLEDGALLDVHLHVGLHVRHSRASTVEAFDVDAVLGEHIGQLGALFVGEAAQYVDVERADRGGRAEQAAAEAGAFLVGPVDQRDGDGWRALSSERAEQFEPGHHPESAVEPAAFRHAVEVRADDEHVRRFAS